MGRRTLTVLCVLGLWPAIAMGATADAGAPFGELELADEVDCGRQGDGDRGFAEYPKGISRVETILGRACRVLPNDAGEAKYFAYRLGTGRGLRAGDAYVLSVEFPDDRPRSMFLCNWGCETARGVHTGHTIGDCLKGKYVNNNPESLNVPVSGTMLAWRQFFHLHDRFPEIKRPRGGAPRPLLPADGFWVIVAQARAINDPRSAGAAVARIRLFRVADPARLNLAIRYPPEGLPRRGLFFREEMADSVIAMGHSPAEKDEKLRGVRNPVDWFEHKAHLMQFLGMNVYSKDLLEFGHNQGWDSAPHGGNAWYNQSPTPGLWEEILAMLGKYGFDVLPYYEYAGSIGQDRAKAIGSQRRCVRLDGGKDYTHIPWVHKTNADLTDPDFIEDARKLLDCTIVRHKDKVRFLGAWLRPRPEANPISFSDEALARFAKEAHNGQAVTRAELKASARFAKEAHNGQAVTRAELKASADLLGKYYGWWFRKRRDFLLGLRDYLRQNVNSQALLLYTADSSEPGSSLPASITAAGVKDGWKWKTAVVSDDPNGWARWLETVRDKDFAMVKPIDFRRVVREDMHLRALLAGVGTWGNWEWQHACPAPDGPNYADCDGAAMTYTFNRLYTVSSAKAFDAFRTRSGLAVVRHYALNENEMHVGGDDLLGYFVADVERAGPYCMLAEARAVAHGDPRFIGYLAGNSFSRGFPQYVRDFNAAFLALPAMPSEIASGACADPEVTVRRIPAGQHGTYLAVVNTGLAEKRDVEIALPPGGAAVTNAATGEKLQPQAGKLKLSLYPGQLVALHVR